MEKFDNLVQTRTDKYLAAMVFALIAFALAVLSNTIFLDGDTNWHVATGLWIMDHQGIPTTDPFSFTAPGRKWVTHEWFSEVLMALAFKGFGWSGVRVLTGLATAAASLIFFRELLRYLKLIPALLVAGLAYEVLMPHVLARPHILALPILAVFVAELLRARREGRRPTLWLLPLMTVWSNMHGSYIFGLAFLGFFGLDAVLEDPADSLLGRVRTGGMWAAFGVAALACSLITPNFIDGLIFPFYVMKMRDLKSIDEWQPIGFDKVSPLEVAVFAAIFMLFYRQMALGPVRTLLLLVLLHMALQHQRQELILAFVGALLIAEPLGRSLAADFPADGTLPAPPPTGRRRWVAGIAVGALLLGSAVRLAVPEVRGSTETTPVAALAHVSPDIRARPVFNDYSFGGWLIFNHVRTFIDGRSDMYGDDFFHQYLESAQGDPARLATVFARYRISWAILRPESPVTGWLARLPDWRLLYRDKWASVYVRSPPSS